MYEQLRDQRDQDTRVEVSVTCIPAWKALLSRASASLSQDSDLPALNSPIDGSAAEEGDGAAAEEEEDASPEARLLALFEKFSMHGKNIAAQKKALLAEEEALHLGRGGADGKKKKKGAGDGKEGGGRARAEEGGGRARAAAGVAGAGAAVQGNRMFTMDQPEFVAFLDHQGLLTER